MPKQKKKEVTIAASTEEIESESGDIENFEEFFNYIGEGYTIVINRSEPAELKGFLEEISLEDNTFSLEYLAKTWGGKQFRVMLRNPDGKWCGRRLINLRSYPPLMRGRRIMDSDEILFGNSKRETRNDGDNILKAAQLLKTLTPENPILPQTSNSNNDMLELLKIILAGQMQQMQSLQQQQIQIPNQQQNSVKNLSEMMGFMSEMKSFWSDNQQNNSGSADDGMIGSIIDIAKTVLSKDQNTQVKQSRLVAPNPVHPKLIVAAENQPENTVREKPIEELIQTALENMTGVEATKLYLMKLQSLPEHDREHALDMVCQALGIEFEDELPDNTSQKTGGQLRPNENDSEGDR